MLVGPLLQQLGWTTDEHVQELYRAYLEHLYPALEMTSLAFRSFVRKNKLLSDSFDNERNVQLFCAIASVGKSATDILTFGKLLYITAAMDPKASTQSVARAQLIIRSVFCNALQN